MLNVILRSPLRQTNKKTLFIIGCLLNVIGIWTALTFQIRHDRVQALSAAETNVYNLARIFEENVQKTTLEIDKLLLYLRREYKEGGGNFGQKVKIVSQLGHDELILQISIINRDGNLVFNDKSTPVKTLNLADREHFTFHRDKPYDNLFISTPVLGRVSNIWSIQFTRKIVKDDGSFDGVIVASVSPRHFSDFYQSVDVGERGAITLFGLDRVIRARASGTSVDDVANGIRVNPDNPSLNPKKPAAGIYSAKSVVDGVLRLSAYRRLHKYPLVVQVGLAEDEIFRLTNARRNTMISIGILATIAFAGSLVLLLWLEKQQLLLTGKLTDRDHQLQKTLAELEKLVTTDALTDLPNRRSFFSRLQSEFIRSARYGRPLTVIMLDLDHFKNVNDTYGHMVGDAVLRHLSAIMRSCVREADMIARYGGEEFVILLPETEREGAAYIAERVRFDVDATPFCHESGENIHVTVSLGVACIAAGEEIADIDKLLQNADEALYKAKNHGRNCIAFATANEAQQLSINMGRDSGEGIQQK
jgi:diguanylate cyclase (GGDEF)-like protein